MKAFCCCCCFASAVALVPIKKLVVNGGKRRRMRRSRLTLDCTHPTEDGTMDTANFEQFLQGRVKVNGKGRNLGGGIKSIK